MIWIEIVIKLCCILFLCVVVLPFARSGIRGAFYAPSDGAAITRMIDMLNLTPGERVVDIGSGDGRIVIALAQRGARAIGIERNMWLVWYSRMRIRYAGLTDRATILHVNVWTYSFEHCDAVTLFGIPYIMKSLETHLQAHLRSGARVVSNRFTFPTWQARRTAHNIHLYIV